MENIKETLAKNQQVHSPTSNRKQEVKCSGCGKNFVAIIWDIDGKEYIPPNCLGCLNKKQEEERKLRLEKEMADAIPRQKELWLKESNIPSLFGDKTFTNFKSQLQPIAMKAVKNLKWKYNGEDYNTLPCSLVLLSPGIYGVGKTHLVCALVHDIINLEEKALIAKESYIWKFRCPVYFISENNLLRNIRDTYNHKDDEGETEEKIYERLKKYKLLIIDDVGKVRPHDLSFLQGVYFNIIDQRYNDSQPIILTTNLDYGELEAHIGGSCADRLREMCGKSGFIKMSGKSFRR